LDAPRQEGLRVETGFVAGSAVSTYVADLDGQYEAATGD
jgi:hypothetical protein